MSYRERIRECNSYDPSRYLAFRIGAAQVGEVRRSFARRLESFTEVFDVGAEGVVMKPELTDFDRRSAAITGWLRQSLLSACNRSASGTPSCMNTV